jgi:Uma2 family endonuclease
MVGAGLLHEDERVQLIEGAILRMTPQLPPHALAIQLVADRLRDVFGAGHTVRVQVPLAISDDSEPEPDVAVVTGGARDYRDEHPSTATLVMEIADSSLMFDRHCKARIYARHGLPEYWILSLVDRSLEVYRQPSASAAAGGPEVEDRALAAPRVNQARFDEPWLDASWCEPLAADAAPGEVSPPHYAEVTVVDAAGHVSPLARPDARISVADLLP